MGTQLGSALGIAVGVCFGGLLAGCSDRGDSGVIEDVREVRTASTGPAMEVPTAERFGMRASSNPHGSGHGPGDGHDHGSEAAGGEFGWDVPEGWEELPPTQMRRANFRVAGDERAECYLTFLPGGAGGVAANVNRWRGQMGLASLTDEEIEALPLRKLISADAVFVDMTGDYRGMGSDAQPDYRMAGLILEAPNATLFLKMVGPSSVIDGEMDHFHELAESFAMGEPQRPSAASGGGASANSAQGMTWETPQGWVRGGERSMRLVTLMPEGAPDTECYVTFLPGHAGGLHANINRWRGQMGQSEMSPEEIAALPHFPVLGQDATFVEIQGDFTGMSGESTSDAGFLGMVGKAGTGTVFIKMTGPADVIAAERQHFLDFCQSLSVEEGL